MYFSYICILPFISFTGDIVYDVFQFFFFIYFIFVYLFFFYFSDISPIVPSAAGAVYLVVLSNYLHPHWDSAEKGQFVFFLLLKLSVKMS